MNIVEYFEMRQQELNDQVAAIESGAVRRITTETSEGNLDITREHVERLKQTAKDFWRAAQNLRRINSSQSNSPST